MRTLWNVLAILVLMAIAGTGVVYAQIFIDPQSPFNPFPPPTLPATLAIPSWTPTYRQLPATWTATYIPQTVTVTKNEILTSLNKPDDFILAIVEFRSDDTHRIHYVRRPFRREPDFGVTSVNYDFAELLARAEAPR